MDIDKKYFLEHLSPNMKEIVDYLEKLGIDSKRQSFAYGGRLHIENDKNPIKISGSVGVDYIELDATNSRVAHRLSLLISRVDIEHYSNQAKADIELFLEDANNLFGKKVR